MGENLNRSLEKPIFVYVFGLFFMIFKTAQFFPYFEWKLFLSFLCLYIAITYTSILITKRIGLGKYIAGWLLISWVTVLFTANIIKLIVYTFKIFFNVDYLFFTAVIACVLFFFFIRNKKILFIHKANKFINIFSFFLLSIIFITGIINARKENQHASNKSYGNIPIMQHKNDIIWILLDEYAAPAYMNNQLQFHNNLVDSLRSKNFYVFDSLASRFDQTIYSLNALFNLDDSIPVSNYQYAAHYLKQSKWVGQLEKQGYSFINLDFLNIGAKEKFMNINMFPDNYTEKIFNNSLFARIANKIKRVDEKMRIDNYNNQVILELTKAEQQKSSPPRFIWSHLLIPHLPFYRNTNGSMNPKYIVDPFLSSKDELSKQYLAYISYANSIVLKILAQIPDGQQKTIIISGDHGARMLLPKDDRRRFITFAAIYSPEMDTIKLKQIKYLQQIPYHLH